MQTAHLFGVSLLCVALYVSCADACGTLSKTKLDVCVAAFSTANLGNRNDRKERKDAGNTTCPVDLLSDSCSSFDVMMKCVNVGGFPSGCQGEFNTELSNQDFECTYLELGDLCPNADKISGASSAVASLSVIAVCLLAFLYNRV